MTSKTSRHNILSSRLSLLHESVASAKSRFVDTGKLSEAEFKYILQILLPFDPSDKKKYIEQIIFYYVNATSEQKKDSNGLEELSDTIRTYDYLLRGAPLEPKEKNITNFKTFDQLKSVVNKHKDGQSNKDKLKQQNVTNKVQGNKINGWTIRPITSQKEACYYGQGTQGCIAADNDNRGNQYRLKDHDSIYFLFKKDQKFGIGIELDGNKYYILNRSDRSIEEGTNGKDSKGLEKAGLLNYPFKIIPFTKSEIKEIATNAKYSYLYAKDVLKGKNIPDIMLKRIATNAQYSYFYVKDVLEGKNIPDIMFKRIAADAGGSYLYAGDVLEGKNVPDIMLKSIATDAGLSYYYAKDVLKGKNIPDIIANSIATNTEGSSEYEKRFGKKTRGPESTAVEESEMYLLNDLINNPKIIKEYQEKGLISEDLTRADIEIIKRLVVSGIEGILQNLFIRRNIATQGINGRL